MNLPTSADIEYDAVKLKAMSEKELLYQLLCQKLLERPQRPHQVAAEQLRLDVAEQVKEIVDSLRAGGLEQFAIAVEKTLVKYESSYNGGGL